MKLYWTIKSIPEFHHLSRKDALHTYWRAYLQTFANWRGWGAVIILLLIVVVGMKTIIIFFPITSVNRFKDMAELVLVIIASGIYWQMVVANIRHFLRKKRGFLGKHNAPQI